MKKNRNDISKNKAEKLAKKGLILEVLISFGFIAIIMFIFFLILLFESNFNVSILLETFLQPCILYLIAIVVFWVLRKPAHIQYAYEKLEKDYSKNFADKNLITGEPTDIILINTRDEAYKDFILGLPHVEKTYAILGKDNLISIYMKFKDADSKLLDVITKEEFLTYCKVVD